MRVLTRWKRCALKEYGFGNIPAFICVLKAIAYRILVYSAIALQATTGVIKSTVFQ